MLVTDLAELSLAQMRDLLVALRSGPTSRASTKLPTKSLPLLKEVIDVLRDAFDTRPDELAPGVRKRLVEVGQALRLLEFPGVPPYGRIDSFDLVTDAQIAEMIGRWVANEAAAQAEGADSPNLAIGAGRRLGTHPGRKTIMRAAIKARSALGGVQGDLEPEEEIAALSALDLGKLTYVADTFETAQRDGQQLTELRSWVLGTWLLHALDGLSNVGYRKVDDGIVTILIDPVAEILTAVDLDAERRPSERDSETRASGQPELTKLAGTSRTPPPPRASSPRSRARRAREMRAITAVSLAVFCYLSPRDSAIMELPDP